MESFATTDDKSKYQRTFFFIDQGYDSGRHSGSGSAEELKTGANPHLSPNSETLEAQHEAEDGRGALDGLYTSGPSSHHSDGEQDPDHGSLSGTSEPDPY